jgi:hypothetical protein
MMDELRRLLELIDTNDNTNISAHYIRSAANVWADRLSRETDKEHRQLKPRIFTYLYSLLGPQYIEKFAMQSNTHLPRYNGRWRDPNAEAVDCLHLPDRL